MRTTAFVLGLLFLFSVASPFVAASDEDDSDSEDEVSLATHHALMFIIIFQRVSFLPKK
jgi:hypothetical protein